jgi:tRNA-2-methylthio-N6-dimethylallyladenosine synthase
MEDNLDRETKGRRLRELQQFQLKIQEEIRKELVGKSFKVLVEREKTMKGVTKWMGRTSCNRIIHFQDNQKRNLQWKWVDLKVTQATALSCQGILI